MGFTASNGQDLYNVFYPLIPGATQIGFNTNFLSGSQDLRYIFRSVVDGQPAGFNTGFTINNQDLKNVFAVLGSIVTPTPTPTPTPTHTYTPTVTPTVTPTATSAAKFKTAVGTGRVKNGNPSIVGLVGKNINGNTIQCTVSLQGGGNIPAGYTLTVKQGSTDVVSVSSTGSSPYITATFTANALEIFNQIVSVSSGSLLESIVVSKMSITNGSGYFVAASHRALSEGPLIGNTTVQLYVSGNDDVALVKRADSIVTATNEYATTPSYTWTLSSANFIETNGPNPKTDFVIDNGAVILECQDLAQYGTQTILTELYSDTGSPPITGSPYVSINVDESNIYYGESVHIDSTASDNSTQIIPSNHVVEVKYGNSNPPTGTYEGILSTTPTNSVDVINNSVYTPNLGSGYYQFRSYADYGTFGRVYSPESSVVFAQQLYQPFNFTKLTAVGGTRHSGMNTLHLAFTVNGYSNVTVTIEPEYSSNTGVDLKTPVIISGDIIQDWYLDGNTRKYVLDVNEGTHVVIVDYRGFGLIIPRITIEWNSGEKFTKGICKCLRTPTTGVNLAIEGINENSQWYTSNRNCVANTNVNTGPNTGSSAGIQATEYGSDFISYMQIGPDSNFSYPNYLANTTPPVNPSNMWVQSAGWYRGGGDLSHIYDGRIKYTNDKGFELLNFCGNINPLTEIGNSKGLYVGIWVDLRGDGNLSINKSKHTAKLFDINATLDFEQAGTHEFEDTNTYTVAGVVADYWWTSIVILKDTNNPTYGWIFKSHQGGTDYPDWQGNFRPWGTSNTISRYRGPGKSNRIIDDGSHPVQWTFRQQQQPYFNYRDTIEMIYCKLPTSMNINMHGGGYIKNNEYRNVAAWVSPIN